MLALVAGCERGAPAGSAAADSPTAATSLLKERAALLDPREHGIGERLPDLAFTDLDGQPGRLSDFAEARALTLVVRDVGCPVSSRIGPATARVEDDFAPRGVAFLYLNVAPHNTAEEMRGEIETFGFDGRYAVDHEGALALRLGARTTTEFFVLDASRTLVYRGALDDRVGRGTVLAEARREFLRAALEEVLERKEVVTPATSAPGCILEFDAPPADGEAETVDDDAAPTYHDRIARILQQNCVECHRTGGAGPFSLETYEQAKGRKGMVRFVVKAGIMPPWFAADGTGPWENDRRLSARDKESLLAWYDAGCPEGDPADAPVPRTWIEGWTIGEPDLVFRLPEPFHVPAEGVVDLTRLYAEERVPADVWIQRMQVLPTDPSVVHHATVMFKPPETYYPTEERILHQLTPWVQSREGWRFLLAYLPGKNPRVFEEGVARFLPQGSLIRFEMHYTPNGVATADRTAIGMVLADEPPVLEAHSRMIRNPNVFVPAREKDVVFHASHAMAFPAQLRSLTPHMHLRGRTFDVDVIQPDGERERVLTVPEWDPDWQFTYTLREPRRLDAGARLQVTASFDNTWDNPNNPDADQDVRDGPQIWDEMLVLVAEWITPRMQD